MMLTALTGAQILLTGATGFVGKVVLEELLRRRDELKIGTVYVLIREKGARRAPELRFDKNVASSGCFAQLPDTWRDHVKVISGDLAFCGMAMQEGAAAMLRDRVTHIIHCAASIEFDPPLAAATAANVTSCLNLLEFARSCERLEAMVSLSTAYVAPHPGDDVVVPEALVDFPLDAEAVYQSIRDGEADAAALLQQTGHPNIYTFTKCLSEQLLASRKGHVPLTLVRPSIISASWQYPEPGWIDSPAAFAAFVSLVGLGVHRSIAARRETLLDIVPCDVVATRVIAACFPSDATAARPLVQHVVAGPELACRVDMCVEGTTRFFQDHPVMRWPGNVYVGRANTLGFRWQDWRLHIFPTKLADIWSSASGKGHKMRRVARRMLNRVNYLNTAFSYFTHHTFHFDTSVPMDVPGFDPKAYVDIVCGGVYRHLMGFDVHETTLAGRQHRPPKRDLSWAWSRPKGNWAIRSSAYMGKKALRKCIDRVTFDRPSFEHAIRKTDPDHLVVVVPSHRSYMDFVLCSYLFFSHPELKIAIPHIAADSEFGRLPFLGWLFKQTHAFYIKRGQGREDPELTASIRELAAANQTLEFFVEGTRSRSRQFLRPKRGLLRSLQSTKFPCTILPISISYDLIPEAQAFIRELGGGPKPKMRLGPLLKWMGQLVRGEVDIGRIHMVCGDPLPFNHHTDVYDLSQAVVGELQDKTITTTYHLACFLHHNPIPDITVDWLQEQIEKRGGTVLTSEISDVTAVDPVIERTMRYHWLHYFYPEALAYDGGHPVIQDHVARNAFASGASMPAPQAPTQTRVQALLRAVFEPICNDYTRVLGTIADADGQLDASDAKGIAAMLSGSFLPDVEAVLEALTERQILASAASGSGLAPGSCWSDLSTFADDCRWSNEPRPAAMISE